MDVNLLFNRNGDKKYYINPMVVQNKCYIIIMVRMCYVMVINSDQYSGNLNDCGALHVIDVGGLIHI